MFAEEKNKRKIDLGNKKVVKKEDFLKKLKEEKTKDIVKANIENSNKIISKFFSKNMNKIYKTASLNEVKKNFNTIVNYCKINKDLDSLQKEKLVIALFQKSFQELNSIYKSINLRNSEKIELSKIILTLLNFLNPSTLKNFIIKNLNLIYRIINSTIQDFYISLKKEYLIDEKILFFSFLKIFIINDLDYYLDKFNIKLSKNVSAIFFLDFIIKNLHKCLNEQTRNMLLKFMLNITIKILSNRSKLKQRNQNINYSNKIVDKFLLNTVLKYLDHPEYLQIQTLKILSTMDFLEFLNSPSSKEYLKNLNEEKLFYVLTEISASLSNLQNRKEYLKKIGESEFDFFMELFVNLTTRFNRTSVNLIFAKSKYDKKEIFRMINNILDFVIEFSSTRSLNTVFKNTIEKFLLFIFYSGKSIEHLYTGIEKTDFHSILDYILNKLAQKYSATAILTDEILLYSIDFIKEKGIKNNLFELLEIICFAIINKIESKENYYFIEFRNTKDIYQNLPFNFMYLNLISKFLIQKFSQLISITNLEDYDLLYHRLIVKCLKALYFLDNEIEFSFNKEAFWSNLELISKMTGYSQNKQVESMKIMPFIFPFKSRLTAMYEYFEFLKSSRIVQYNQYDEDSRRNYNLTIHRDHIFEETLNLYLNNQLDPLSVWRITFIDRHGMREEGVDAGGLFKEYIYKLSEQVFSTNSKYFVESNSGFLMPNPDSSVISPFHLKIYEFCGFLIGIGLIHDIKTAPNFSLFFLNNILELENPFTELKSYDADLYKNLVNLKNYEGDVENDFGLNFTLNEQREGKMQTVNLIDNGNKVNVNNHNKLLYIKKVAQYKLTHQIKNQCEAFRRGILNVIQNEIILQIFTADELRQLIYGFDKEAFDVGDLKVNTEYGKEYCFIIILIRILGF